MSQDAAFGCGPSRRALGGADAVLPASGTAPYLLRSFAGNERVAALRPAVDRVQRLYDVRLVCPPERPAGETVDNRRAGQLGHRPV